MEKSKLRHLEKNEQALKNTILLYNSIGYENLSDNQRKDYEEIRNRLKEIANNQKESTNA